MSYWGGVGIMDKFTPRKKKQQGAVMLETAYVLPIVLAAILFVVEVTSYALNSFAANDVLTDLHTAIISEVEAVSNKEAGQTLSPEPIYAFCDGSQVALRPDSATNLKAHIQAAMEAKGVTIDGTSIAATISKNEVGGFDVYVINFKGTPATRIVPDMFGEMLKIDVDTIISLKDSCTP